MAAAGALMTLPLESLAQSASQVTPKGGPPEAQHPPERTAPPTPAKRASTAPPGSEKLNVTVGDVSVEGGFPELAGATERLVAPFQGRRVTVAALYDLAADLESAYARAGYILVRVEPPPQHLEDGGVFHMRVVDGFIESVDVAKVPAPLRGPITARMAGVVGRHHLRLGELERALMQAAAVPGAEVRSTIVAGSAPGASRLVLEALYHPVTGGLTLNNGLGSAFDDWSLDGQIAFNSPTGHGEQVYAFVSLDPDLSRAFRRDAPRKVAGIGVSMPVGGSGLEINPEIIASDTRPKAGAGVVPTAGEFRKYSLRASYPLVSSRTRTVSLTGSFEVEDERQTAPTFGVTLNQDSLRVARVSLSWDEGVAGGGSVRWMVQISQGIDGLGARTQADALASGIPLSRAGSAPDFSTVTVQASWTTTLPKDFRLQLSARAQAALNGAMPSSELFSLDGRDALSSFTAGAVGSDGGWTVRAQVSRTFIGKIGSSGRYAFTPYAFAAYGHASYETPTLLPTTHATDAGLGFDLRFDGGPAGLKPFVGMEAGRHTANGLERDDSRVAVTLGVRF
ncbi:MAG: ShlB/FhaC/HecB family hemolysin secretion/activation protein [Caulobacter sp.]|nr:ShlB/FhaC/HecB family hemolysin secretion/activation protein [Caulobacter sp.]